MGGRARERREGSLRRSPWKKIPRKVILIACEGEKTERIYLDGLRAAWRILTAEIQVLGVGMTPSKVVEEAVDRKTTRHREAKKGNDVDYDEVWCVYDRDTHTDLDEARRLAVKHKIRVALSVPCFEIWYLMHFVYTTRPFQNFDELASQLKEHIADYDKARDYTAILLPLLEAALTNGRQLRTFKQANDTTCPATDVDLLVETMKQLAAL